MAAARARVDAPPFALLGAEHGACQYGPFGRLTGSGGEQGTRRGQGLPRTDAGQRDEHHHRRAPERGEVDFVSEEGALLVRDAYVDQVRAVAGGGEVMDVLVGGK